MEISILPSINASLNATSAFFLGLGYIFIRQRYIQAHKICMGTAFVASMLFLTGYVYYHIHHGSTPFPGVGPVRIFYFSLLISHVVLAIAIVPLAIITLFRGVYGQFEKHVKIARITLPIWFYVSITGVIIYWILYHVYGEVTVV